MAQKRVLNPLPRKYFFDIDLFIKQEKAYCRRMGKGAQRE
jgi:hypothetical protein